MGSKLSIICMGELLIDFYCTDIGIDLINGYHFKKEAGGAPANVCATIVRLGGKATFSGKVGDDPFGHFLRKVLDDLNVDTSMLIVDDSHPTTLAFVALKEDGERDFVFNRGADAYLLEKELDQEKIVKGSILHFGSATALLEEPFRSTYLKTMQGAKTQEKFISFDPNFRGDLWKGRGTDFVDLVTKGISFADFVKVSDDELRMISGVNDINEGVSILHKIGAKAVAVTLGKEGTLISNVKNKGTVESIRVNAIDSTGAGDAFVGAVLYQLANTGAPKKVLEDFAELKKIIYFSNVVGALVCTKVGAISAIPSYEEAMKYIYKEI